MGYSVNNSPVMTVNIYSTLEVGQFKFDAQPMVMRYVIATLREVLVNDYACPAEFGYDAGDVLRMAYLSAATEDSSDFSNLDPAAYEKIKTAILAEGTLYKIAADVIENYKMRCAPDQPVALYFIGADIFVGLERRVIMDNKAAITSFGSEVIRFKRELNEDAIFVKDLMLDLITNMLYWNSYWSPAKSSNVVMLEDWNITHQENNALANDIFRIHTSIENMFRSIDDRRWGIFTIDIILDNGDYFDVAIRKMGDYRIEQWNSDHGKELCPNGALRESISGNRWHESGRSNAIVRARQRHRPQ